MPSLHAGMCQHCLAPTVVMDAPMEQVKRVVSALVLLPLLVFVLLYTSPLVFLVLVLMCMGLSLREYFQILHDVCPSLCQYVTWLATLALALAVYYGGALWLQPLWFCGVVVLTLTVMLTSTPVTQLWPVFVSSVFGLFLIGWTLSHLLMLRLLPDGPWYLLFLCAVVWVGDSAAMYV